MIAVVSVMKGFTNTGYTENVCHPESRRRRRTSQLGPRLLRRENASFINGDPTAR